MIRYVIKLSDYFSIGEPNISRFDSGLLTEMSLIVNVIDFKLSLTVAKISSFRNQHEALNFKVSPAV